MKQLVLLILLSGPFFLFGSSGDVEIPLPDLVNPDSIHIHKDTLLITDGEKVSLYNLKDFSRIKSFGKKGEGPGEFKFPSAGVVKLQSVFRYPGFIVNSMNRVTFFGPDGKYQKEVNVASGFHFIPLGKRYAGYAVVNRGRVMVLAVNLYDEHFKFYKEIFSKKYYVQTTGKFDLVRAGSGNKRRAYYMVYRDKLYVEGENRIHVFEPHGKESRVIAPVYNRIRITSGQKDEIRNSLKTLFPSPLMQKLIRDNGYFPQRFPVRAFIISDDRIWIPTYQRKKGKTLFMVLDLTGEMRGSGWFPFHNQTLLIPYPFTIAKGKIYQLYDVDGGDWKLIISPFLKGESGFQMVPVPIYPE